MSDRIASCACGCVRLGTSGEPIITAICHCDDCQAGARLLKSMGAAGDFQDPWGGTAYATYRDDRLAWIRGADRLRGVKLGADAPTTRFLATCCNTPMCLKHGPGWWTSVYRGRLGAAAPPCTMRLQTRYIPSDAPAALPDSLPRHRRFAVGFILRLMAAGLRMRLGV
jgi:hypothetical protein